MTIGTAVSALDIGGKVLVGTGGNSQDMKKDGEGNVDGPKGRKKSKAQYQTTQILYTLQFSTRAVSLGSGTEGRMSGREQTKGQQGRKREVWLKLKSLSQLRSIGKVPSGSPSARLRRLRIREWDVRYTFVAFV